MKKIILIGGGGHALSVLEMAEDLSLFEGYADLQENVDMPIPYLGTDEEVMANYPAGEFQIHHTLVYAKEVNLNLRLKMIQKYAAYEKAVLVAKTAYITPNSHIGSGTGVFHGAIINRARIGSNCIVNTGAVIEHNVHAGDNVFVGPNATICGGVNIGNNVLIGAGAIIRDDVKICSDVVIGMGSIVTHDITQTGVYVGCPAKFVKKLYKYE